jgi:hypothetical protein
MDNDQVTVGRSELLRWIVVAALIVVGVTLYFIFARSTRPAVPPTVEETPR